MLNLAGQSPCRSAAPRDIAVLAFTDVLLLDVVGPLEVFAAASRHLARLAQPLPYRIEVVGATSGQIVASSGLEIRATRSLAELADPGRSIQMDTVLVAGGPGVDALAEDSLLLRLLRDLAPPRGARRLGAVCTGAFLLAAAGLLDGRRAVTHWAHCAELAKRFPGIRVETDPIFVRDGAIYTSAGVTAGMDLALALVEEDYGRDVALAVARSLVMFHKRPGGQTQFSTHLAAQMAGSDDDPISKVQGWILDNLAADLSIDALAGRAAMSPRNFARIFARAAGTTPARFVERARLDGARQLLEEISAPLDMIARRCGFGSAEILRRVCRRHLGIGPSEYRQRFQRSPPGAAETAPAAASDSVPHL
jgi:transcriptional regulator GlxA family with amidase domain